MTAAELPRGPLSGIRVIDWTIWQQGPVAGAMLGDLGAEVIKIEERERGDGGRAIYRLDADSGSPYWEMNNRNKRSIAIDLKQPEGAAIARDLIAGADVFVQNFRPSVAEKVGLGYEELRALNPRLIYASASAFGVHGEEARARAYDLLGQARAGLLMRDPNATEPDVPDGGLADQMGAIMLAYGVLAALVARERLGVGQKVDTSLLGSMMWLRGLPMAVALMSPEGRTIPSGSFQQGASAGSRSRARPGNPLWNTYRCGDGRWIALALLQSDPHWATLLHALDDPAALATDPRFADHVARCRNAEACTQVLDGIFAQRPRAEWLRRLIVKGDLPVGPVNTTAEAASDPQAIANRYVTTLDHPTYGRLAVPGFVVELSETPAQIRRHAPEFGEHTEEVLIETLGLGWEDISRLKARAVI